MKVRIPRRMPVIVSVALMMLAVPGPAEAETVCKQHSRVPQTIGVAGQPVLTTPNMHVQVCVTADGDPTALPIPRIIQEPYFAIVLEQPGGGPADVTVSVTYAVGGSPVEESVTVPVPGELWDGRTQCIVFMGESEYNLGNCLVYLEQ